MKLRIKKHRTRKVCGIFRCTSKCEGRGLCILHYQYCSTHNLLDVYGVPAYRGKKHNLTVNKDEDPFKCRTLKEGEKCTSKVYSRGLCHVHYNMFFRRGTLNKMGLSPYANPKQKIGVRDYDYDNN